MISMWFRKYDFTCTGFFKTLCGRSICFYFRHFLFSIISTLYLRRFSKRPKLWQ